MVAKRSIFLTKEFSMIHVNTLKEVELSPPLLACRLGLQRAERGNRMTVTLQWRSWTHHVSHMAEVPVEVPVEVMLAPPVPS